jgi:hypothetical protein
MQRRWYEKSLPTRAARPGAAPAPPPAETVEHLDSRAFRAMAATPRLVLLRVAFFGE